MEVTARPAIVDDLPTLVGLYRLLEKEMAELHPMWPLADGLAEPVEEALTAAVGQTDTLVFIGEIDGYPLGFLIATLETLLPQAGGGRVGSLRLVFTEPEAREVGVGEAMRQAAMTALRRMGITRFDAHVLPGHRLTKNFFEAGGFAARHIIMFHDDAEDPGAGGAVGR